MEVTTLLLRLSIHQNKEHRYALHLFLLRHSVLMHDENRVDWLQLNRKPELCLLQTPAMRYDADTI